VNTNRDYAYYTHVQQSDTSLNELLLVNKYYQLDASYVPNDLISVSPYGTVKMVKIAADAFISLCDAANNEGYTIIGISGYRSYSTQENLYNRYLKKDPQWRVDTYSARAGFSEHQSGLAIDVSSNNQDILTFEMSNSFQWMKDHAHLYGFILRYQKGKEDISGYKYEPWHYRYVGKEIAATLYSTGMTYDEYAALYLIK
jgi:D-alanyl-D-alanine carboxypeptidase